MSVTHRELGAGSIQNQIAAAILLAKKEKCEVTFIFNTWLTVTVRPRSNLALMLRDYKRASAHYIEPNIGPLPKRKLSRTEVLSDKRIMAKIDMKTADDKIARLEAELRTAKNRRRGLLGYQRKMGWI